MPLKDIVIGRDEDDREKYGEKGSIYFGRHLVGEGAEANLTNPVRLDVARPHVSLICGKRGQGKCLLPEEKIQLADGRLVKIKEFYEETKNNGDKKIDEDDETLIELKKKPKVTSIDDNLQACEKNVSHLYRKRINEKSIKITTKTGEKIKVTKEHPLLNNNLDWKEAGDLSKGDFIAAKTGNRKLEDSQCEVKDLFWDEIVSVEEIEYKGWVYDITVPKTHNFLAGENGGLVCHNSYTGAVIAEEFFRLPDEVRNNLSMLMIDTMGIWWSLKNPNEKQISLLKDWGLKPRSFDADVYIPEGFEEQYKEADVPFDHTFSIRASSLSTEDWSIAFDISLVDPLGVLLERVMRTLEDEENYGVEGIIEAIKNDERSSKDVKQALENRFLSAKEWGIFSQEGLTIEEILSPGKVSVLDMSYFGHLSSGWSVRGLLTGLLSRRIYRKRVEARRQEEVSSIRGTKNISVPMTWILIDEAHQFLPADGKTPASGPLTTLVKEGRQPGISVSFITQRPGAIHPNAISQSDLIISHRLTARPDLEALRNIMQTYMTFDIKDYINDLPRKKGAAIVLDDNSERIYSMRVRPRMSWHAGSTPIALEEKEEF